ncbi:MAG: hypothetical protein ACLQBJ_19040 [Bryobacteraceae bacterium]
MTFDEALLVVRANAPAIIENLFKPCTCGQADIKHGGEMSFELHFRGPDDPKPQPCLRCQARHILLFLVALGSDTRNQDPVMLMSFTSLVEELPS